MCELKEKLLKDFDKKTFALGRKIDEIFMFWQHDKKELENFFRISEFLSSHSEIYRQLFMEENKFSRCFSQKKVQLVIDFYIKPTDMHKYLYAIACHVYHFQKYVCYSQA